MAPYTESSMDFTCEQPLRYASNWDRSVIDEIYNNSGCPPRAQCQSRTPYLPLIPARPAPCPPVRSDCNSSPGPCRLPPINTSSRTLCGNHPRDDCCRIPQFPCPPACTPAYCVEKVQPHKPTHDYNPPCQPFNACSLYRTNFVGQYGPPAASAKPYESLEFPSAKFAGLSHYRETFTCKPLDPRKSMKKDAVYAPSCAPFNGISTYRVDFRGSCGSPADSAKPSPTIDFSNARFEGLSSYRNDYIPYCSAEYNYAKGNPHKHEAETGLTCAPFDGCSLYRMDFSNKCGTKADSCKPHPVPAFSDARFSGCTTYKNDFLPFYFKNHCPRGHYALPSGCC